MFLPGRIVAQLLGLVGRCTQVTHSFNRCLFSICDEPGIVFRKDSSCHLRSYSACINSCNPLKDPVGVQYGHSPVVRGTEKLRHLQSTQPVCGWWHLSPGSLAPEPLPRPPPSISHSCRVPPPQPSPPTPFPSPSTRHLPNGDHEPP